MTGINECQYYGSVDPEALKQAEETAKTATPDQIDWTQSLRFDDQNVSKESDILRLKPTKAAISEEVKLETGLKLFHLKNGFKAAFDLSIFYWKNWVKNNKVNENFNFDDLVSAYNSSTIK